MAITLTEKAAAEIKKIVSEQGLPEAETRLRVGVKGGGCSGFSYMLDLTEEPAGESDEELESHGVKILCDMKEPAVSQRHRSRFQGRSHGKRLCLQKPQCHQQLRLRKLVLGMKQRFSGNSNERNSKPSNE